MKGPGREKIFLQEKDRQTKMPIPAPPQGGGNRSGHSPSGPENFADYFPAGGPPTVMKRSMPSKVFGPIPGTLTMSDGLANGP
jgi:hypothetical protein